MGIIKSVSIKLLKIEIFIVAGAIGISMVFTRLLPYALAITAVFWVLRWLLFGYPSVRTPNDWAIGLLIIMAFISLWVTAQHDITRPQVYRLLLGIGFYYVIVNWSDTRFKLRLLISALSLTGLFLSIFGLFSVQWATTKVPLMPDLIYNYIPTISTDLIHRNVLAGTLVLIIPIPIALLIYSWHEIKQIEKIIYAFSAISMIAIHVLTQSRAGWMAFIFSMGILALIGGKRTRLLLLLGIFIGIIVIFFVGITPLLDAVIANNTIGGIEGRIITWSRAIHIISNFPFTGAGLGNFGYVSSLLYPGYLAPPESVPHAHNLFFQIGVDLGIPGLIGWLAILFVIFTVSWQLYKIGKHSGNKILMGLGIGLFCSQVALCTHGLLDAVTWGMVRPAPIIWGIWGLTVGSGLLYLIENQNIKNKI